VSSSAVEAEVGINLPPAPQWVVFRCADRRLALPLDRVREILTPRPFSRLPGTGPEVCGLVGVRTRIVTAFDLGVILGLSPARDASDHRLLLVEHGERTPALVVEEVLAVAPAELTAVGSYTTPAALDRQLILASGEFEGIPFMALDSDRLLDRLLI
jgi:chemotaxis signal transduction protein